MSRSVLEDTLDTLVPAFADEPRRWQDVLRRVDPPQRLARRRTVVIVAAAALSVLTAAAIAAPLGLGGGLLELVRRDKAFHVRLPKAADRAHVAVALEPGTGRVLLMAAPKRLDDGMCYVYFPERTNGCSLRSKHGALFGGGTQPFGYSFDARAASADVRLASGKRVSLRFVRFRGRIGTAFFFARRPLDEPAKLYYVRDRAGTVIMRGDLRRVR
jgi:hypothetical protein